MVTFIDDQAQVQVVKEGQSLSLLVTGEPQLVGDGPYEVQRLGTPEHELGRQLRACNDWSRRSLGGGALV
jgi:hypothetical protein